MKVGLCLFLVSLFSFSALGSPKRERMLIVTEDEKAEIQKLDPFSPTLVVIEGMSDGAEYAPTARALFPGIQVIHLQVGLVLNPGKAHTFVRKHYDANLIWTGENGNAVQEMLWPFKQGNLKVVVGMEAAVEVHDEVCELLGLPKSSARPGHSMRNKIEMENVARPFLEKVGIETIPALATSDPKVALSWIAKHTGYPVFVKPVASSGSFGGRTCHSDREVRRAFKLVGSKDPSNEKIREMIVQPAISDAELREVVPDGFFDEETGFVATDFFEYDKERERHPLYRGARLTRWDLTEPTQLKLFNGAQALGEAFQIRNAPLHPEFFVIGNRVIFVEVGRRAAGGGMSQFVRACGGTDQVTIHLLSLFDRERFLQISQKVSSEAGSPRVAPQPTTEGNMMDLVYKGSPGIVKSIPTIEEIRKRVPGFYSASLSGMKRNRWLEPTSGLYGYPGTITVQGSDEVINAADAALRAWQESTFYDVRPPNICERILRFYSRIRKR